MKEFATDDNEQRIHVGSTLSALRVEGEQRAVCRDCLGHLLVFYLFLMIIFLQRDPNFAFQMDSSLRRVYIDASFAPQRSITDVVTREDVMMWLENVWIAQTYVEHDELGRPLSAEDKYYVARMNKVIARPLLRVKRGKTGPQYCTGGAVNYNPNFHVKCTERKVDLTPWGPPQDPERYKPYFSPDDSVALEYSARYLFDVDASNSTGGGTRAAAIAALHQLRDDGFFDQRTTLLEAHQLVYNGQIKMCSYMKISFDFTRGGTINAFSTGAAASFFLSFDLLPYETGKDTIRTLHEIAFVLCFLVNVALEVKSAVAVGFRKHVRSFWNWVDALYLACIFVTVCVWVVYLIRGGPRRTLLKTVDVIEYPDRDIYDSGSIIGVTRAWFIMNDFILLLACVKFFKYFRYHPGMSVLTTSLSHAAGELLHFGVIFTAVIFTYAMMGHYYFGVSVPAFATFDSSFVTCFSMLLGFFEYSTLINGVDTSFGLVPPVFYWTFMITGNLILLNMFLVIVIDAYEQIRQMRLDKESGVGAASLDVGALMRPMATSLCCSRLVYPSETVLAVALSDHEKTLSADSDVPVVYFTRQDVMDALPEAFSSDRVVDIIMERYPKQDQTIRFAWEFQSLRGK